MSPGFDLRIISESSDLRDLLEVHSIAWRLTFCLSYTHIGKKFRKTDQLRP